MNCIQPCMAWIEPITDELASVFAECCPIFMDMMHAATDHLKVGWEGRLINDITDLSVAERAVHIAAGILLLIPGINLIVFAILECPTTAPVSPAVIDDAFFERNLQVPLATAEEYAQRKQEACRFLQRNPTIQRQFWRCAPAVRPFDVTEALRFYSTDYRPSDLGRFAHLLPAERRESFRACLHGIGSFQHWNKARASMSRLYDFLRQRWDEYSGTERESAFKGYVAGILMQVLDARQNCVDQLNSQLETLLINVIIGWEVERAGASVELALQKRTGYELFRYLLNLIKQACVVEYPNYVHMADLERHAKTELIQDNSGVIRTGAITSFPREKVDHIRNVVFQGARREAPRCYYDPLNHLIAELRVYHGDMRVLRNKILLWARAYYGLEADDPLTQNFIHQISADPNLPADEGGDLTEGAMVCFLRQLGILQENPSGNTQWRLEMARQNNPVRLLWT